jgi:hypothetical protein
MMASPSGRGVDWRWTMSILARRISAVAVVTLALGGCQDAVTPLVPSPQRAQPSHSLLGLDDDRDIELRLVSPTEADPAPSAPLLWVEPHYVWLNRRTYSNGGLLLFFGGANSTPSQMQGLARVAAGVGYHVIVLEYANRNVGRPGSPYGVGRCSGDPDPFGCQEKMRLEILDGGNRGLLVSVDEANSIYTRVTKLLGYLARTYPLEGWGSFLEAGQPKWSEIAVGGFSLGGGQAALIAKQHLVDRVVLLAAPLDGFAGPTPGSWTAGSWVTTDATPANRYFGLSHLRDDNFIKGATLANWARLGLTPFEPPISVPFLTDPYLLGSHMLVTNRAPAPCGALLAGFHRSIAEDPCTPLDASGLPALRWGWIYLLRFPYDLGSTDRGE